MKRRGFTLIEVLIAAILIGMAIAGLIGANISFTRSNSAGVNMTTAEFLIEQIRELTMPLPVFDPEGFAGTFGAEEASLADYDDIDDFDGKTFNPPINIAREVINDLGTFTQEVTVENVSTSNLEQVVADHSSNFVRMTVTITLNNRQILSTSWVRARY